MSPLPVVLDATELAVIDPDTGESLAVRDASDRALVHAAHEVAELDRQLLEAKRTLAAELRHRHGVGVTRAGGYLFTVGEQRSWPAGRTRDALRRLVDDGHIEQADADRAMPSKPKPDSRALNALAGRLATSNPDAARVLAEACTTSPPAVKDIRLDAIDEA